MYPYQNNYVVQNQRVQYPNYGQGPMVNPIQASINNQNQIIKQYDGSPQLGNLNPINLAYNPVNIMPPQINLNNQQQNIGLFPPNQNNLNIIQPQNLNQNTSNIIYNQSRLNQIPIQNNIIPHNQVINVNQNIFQGEFNQEIPSNINEIIPGYNLDESRIINTLINNTQILNRKNESKNGHPPIPIKFTIEAMQSICKISLPL